mgnify:CR=1 FL=1
MASRDRIIRSLQQDTTLLLNTVFFINPATGKKLPGKDKQNLLF